MLSQHSKKRDAGAPNIVPDPLVDPGNPSHRYQARSTAHLDRPCSRMVALAASSPGRRSPRSPQTTNATVMLDAAVIPEAREALLLPPLCERFVECAFARGALFDGDDGAALVGIDQRDVEPGA